MSDSAKSQSVLIPLALFKKIIELLEYVDIMSYDECIQDDYRLVRNALFIKSEKLNLRKTYANVLYAKDEDERDMARIRYLSEKHYLYGFPYKR
jgi:hypothetical protein